MGVHGLMYFVNENKWVPLQCSLKIMQVCLFVRVCVCAWKGEGGFIEIDMIIILTLLVIVVSKLTCMTV